MSILVCLLKGCGISRTKKGYVICPDCKTNYCWDRDFGPWALRSQLRGSPGSAYPFGNWVHCTHGDRCKARRLHKNRNDSLAAFVIENEKLDRRHERYRRVAPKSNL